MDVLGDDVCILGLVVAAGREGGGGEGEGPVCGNREAACARAFGMGNARNGEEGLGGGVHKGVCGCGWGGGGVVKGGVLTSWMGWVSRGEGLMGWGVGGCGLAGAGRFAS